MQQCFLRLIVMSVFFFLGNSAAVDTSAVTTQMNNVAAQGSQAVTSLVARTTGNTPLTDAEIARMNAEATVAGSQFKNLGILGQATSVVKAGVRVVTNPVTTIFSFVAPLGMFVYGFLDQAFKSIQNTDYMDSSLAIMVDPKVQWSALMVAEKTALAKAAGLKPAATTTPAAAAATATTTTAVATPVATSATTTPATTTSSATATPAAPSAKELDAAGWALKYKAGPVGIAYDFGFSGAGDDPSEPFGFIRSATTGQYYYRPVRGKMRPESMPIEGKSYGVDFRKRPFNVLVPRLMFSLVGEQIASKMWNGMLDFTQLDPVKIFLMKTMLLFTSVVRNSFKRVQTKIDDAGQVYTKASWGTYRSVDKGAAYPALGNMHTELAKLIQRLKHTPDIKRTVAANGGQTMPSKWDTSKIVYLGNVNPGLILLSMMPSSFKELLNLIFKVKVNFYEYQAALDIRQKVKPSDIDTLYGHVRSYDTSADGIKEIQAAAEAGEYVDSYILKTRAVQKYVSAINWKNGAQDFTDTMKLFFLLRWMLKEVHSGIEFIVSSYEQLSSATPAVSSADSQVSVDGGLQDQSVASDAMLGKDFDRKIDFDLLSNKVLTARVAALKNYVSFVKQYVSSFVANSIGNSSIDDHYVRFAIGRDSQGFSVQKGGADDLATYFPPAVMKKVLSEYVASLSRDASTALASIDLEMDVLKGLAKKAQAADKAYHDAANVSTIVLESLVSAKIDTLDDLISELRKRQLAAQSFGVYPLGYDEQYLKTVELPGAVYLAYSMNFQSRLLSRPFEGDALYYYDDSFYDADSSYMYLLSLLMRANDDLSRAASVVSGINGPVEFKDADGKKYTVPNGAEFYLNNLKKYDQYYLLQEQNFRKLSDVIPKDQGALTPNEKAQKDKYEKAQTDYTNAKRLLVQKKREMNNILLTFEFDRRSGVSYLPSSSVNTTAQSAVNKGSAALGVAPVSTTSTGAVAVPSNSAADVKRGVVGTLDDGTVVYSYERSVLGFLQAELARFAFRSEMMKIDDLKELVFAVTGIQAEQLWQGVESKKRQIFFAQKATADAPKPEVVVDADEALDDLLGDSGDEALVDVVAEEPVDVSVTSSEPGLSAGSSGVVEHVAPQVHHVVQDPAVIVPQADVALVPPLTSSAEPTVVPASVSFAPEVVRPVERSAKLLEISDLDKVVADNSGRSLASGESFGSRLDGLFAGGALAAGAKDGELFTQYLQNLVAASVLQQDMSSDDELALISALQKAMGLLSFVDPAGFSDINSFDNLLEVVTYLKGGVLSSRASSLSLMEEQLNAWLRSH